MKEYVNANHTSIQVFYGSNVGAGGEKVGTL